MDLTEERIEQIDRRLKVAEGRLLAYPWKDWPPDRVKDLVEDLRALLDQVRGRSS